MKRNIFIPLNLRNESPSNLTEVGLLITAGAIFNLWCLPEKLNFWDNNYTFITCKKSGQEIKVLKKLRSECQGDTLCCLLKRLVSFSMHIILDKINYYLRKIIYCWISWLSDLISGFDDQDMERPSFTQPSQHPTIPMVLSEAGVKPVIQVNCFCTVTHD